MLGWKKVRAQWEKGEFVGHLTPSKVLKDPQGGEPPKKHPTVENLKKWTTDSKNGDLGGVVLLVCFGGGCFVCCGWIVWVVGVVFFLGFLF